MARRSLLLAAVGLAVLAACQSPSAGYRSEETDPDVRLLALMDAYRGVEPPEPEPGEETRFRARMSLASNQPRLRWASRLFCCRMSCSTCRVRDAP